MDPCSSNPYCSRLHCSLKVQMPIRVGSRVNVCEAIVNISWQLGRELCCRFWQMNLYNHSNPCQECSSPSYWCEMKYFLLCTTSKQAFSKCKFLTLGETKTAIWKPSATWGAGGMWKAASTTFTVSYCKQRISTWTIKKAGLAPDSQMHMKEIILARLGACTFPYTEDL